MLELHYTVGILTKLRIHKENVMEEVLELYADKTEHISEILKTENNSIWVGRVKKLNLVGDVVDILPKLDFHEENVMEELLVFYADKTEHISEILKTENNSIWIGKVHRLSLKNNAIQLLPKLRIHEDNVMEELWLNAYEVDQITEILKTENNSVWVGK
ncbi:MAG: uncharacterized protein A8A55_3498, partial [Amphiamblys sp. WSBS2006]